MSKQDTNNYNSSEKEAKELCEELDNKNFIRIKTLIFTNKF